jgi:hypothetical protein
MSEIKVETVKKGDVLFQLDRKIELLNKFIADDEKSEVEWANNNNKILKEWHNGRLSARLCDLESLESLRNLINKL